MAWLPFVYVSGPITAPDPLRNLSDALDTFHELLDSGLVAPFLPHLSCFAEIHRPRIYDDWLDLDRQVIARCDAVLRLPGRSAGADLEVGWAQGVIPVFTDKARLLRWAHDQVTEKAAR